MRTAVSGFLVYVVAFAVLQAAYPWSTYYGNFEFGWWPTLSSYLVVAGLMAGTAALTTGLLLKTPSSSVILRAAGCGVITFAFAVMVSFIFGPGGFNIPGTRVRGIFFSEWQFLSFLFLVAAPVSLVAGILCGWAARRQLRSTSS